MEAYLKEIELQIKNSILQPVRLPQPIEKDAISELVKSYFSQP